MARNLSQDVIDQRMVEWRNLTVAKERDVEIIRKLRTENKTLKERIGTLEAIVDKILAANEKLALRVEDLGTKVFGKKPKKKASDDDASRTKKPKSPRTKDSYHRPIPSENEITSTERHTITNCPKCGTPLCKQKERIFYVEDITLPITSIIKHIALVGYCTNCRLWHSPVTIPSATVTVGETVRTHVAYAATVLRLSYEQIRSDLQNRFAFSLSRGEIPKVLKRMAERHTSDYEQLVKNMHNEPIVHVDETGDRVRDGDGYKAYTWLAQAPNKPEVVFSMGRTRGKGVAEELVGNTPGIGVTDDYGAYTNIFTDHQLCWAHLHRKLRDLAQSSVIEGDAHVRCGITYDHESAIYEKVRSLANRDDLTDRQRNVWYTKLTHRLNQLAIIHPDDPEKLKTYKTTLQSNIPKYLTCIRLPNVPCDNNQAERTLRHVVLKRKTSFGHITAKGAETMSILMSVLMTVKNRIQDSNQTFFEGYRRLCAEGV
jgi:transposase